ncbi:glycosyltransferase family 2 protein [Vineibacter terrae]|uniref:Glycosyltransferase family 2 protein n=2 Tax=Vineibacter terrae TaxID=2586908 RepID=A0A5C8PKL3_9HYPH|nr:glycosyltransferase family 2 protein [Vineibacter terrae]
MPAIDMDITVIVPTYKRPDDLRQCLDALKRQTLPAARVNVVRRDSDSATAALLAGYDAGGLAMQVHVVDVPGVVAALNIGLEHAVGEAVAMTDDDAAPHPDWLERIAGHFQADARVGGVGGRDRIFQDNRKDDWPPRTRVGVSTWYGRVEGNHNCGVGPAREVEALKGVCMAFRRRAIGALRFDRRLRGRGAQVANEALFGGAIRLAGWTLVYDPAVLVDHYPSVRPDSDQRNQLDQGALRDLIHNATLGHLEYWPAHRAAAIMLYQLLWGSRLSPGVAAALVYTLRGDKLALAALREVVMGTLAGICTCWRTRRADVAPRRAVPFGVQR